MVRGSQGTRGHRCRVHIGQSAGGLARRGAPCPRAARHHPSQHRRRKEAEQAVSGLLPARVRGSRVGARGVERCPRVEVGAQVAGRVPAAATLEGAEGPEGAMAKGLAGHRRRGPQVEELARRRAARGLAFCAQACRKTTRRRGAKGGRREGSGSRLTTKGL